MASHRHTVDPDDLPLEPLSSLSVEPQQGFSLAPPDEGRAWLVLAGNFLTDALIWGLPFTFGVFQEHYSRLPDFAPDAASISTIGTVALGVLYLISPISFLLLRQFPKHLRTSMWIGLAIVCLSLVCASFSTQVWQLILTQGFLYAVGASMVSYPGLVFVDQWFVRRKGTAFGISWAGASASGLILPYLLSWSLNTFSFQTTLRWWAVLNLLWVGPMILLFKPRIPPSTVARFTWPDLKYTITQPFASLQIGIILQSLGYFLPSIYLPSYTLQLGMDRTVATTSVTLLNAGTFVGCLSFGFLIDHWSTTGAIFLSALGAALSITVLWGLSGAAATVCIFAFAYGLCTGGFTATWPGIVRDTVRLHPSTEPGLAYSLLVASRGIGNLISGPLSAALLKAAPLGRNISYGYGSKYSALILFSGVSAFLGTTGFFARLHSRLR